MDAYIGLFYREKTSEIKQIINELIGEEKRFFYQNKHLFLSSQTEFLSNEYFISKEKTILLFVGECFNQSEIIEKSGLDRNVTFIEALASLYEQGHQHSFCEIRGYFTLIIFDKVLEKLLLVRDQFGVQLLFYQKIQNGILFSDSKKQLFSIVRKQKVNQEALQQYLSFQYVTNPLTMSKDIKCVSAGNYLVVTNEIKLALTEYFKRTFRPAISEKNYFIKRIREALYDSVSRMMNDRESIGTLLSGGIDSTLITALAKEINPNLKTFSVGFEYDGYSEIDLAKKLADLLGLENISIKISAEQYVEKLPEIIWHLGDPLADPSCVPLYFVTREAKKHVNSILSGEGADEFFAGYKIYRESKSLQLFNYVPSIFKKSIHKIGSVLPDGVKGKSFLLRGTTPLEERYIGNAKIFEEQEKRLILVKYDESFTYRKVTGPLYKDVKDDHPVTQMQYIDIHTWLPGNILFKANKIARANSLTLLMPFIDVNVFQIARELPESLLLAKRTTKLLLREAAKGIVPDHVLDRDKLGFPVPLSNWLKNELYDWAKTLIIESETDEYLHKNVVLEMLEFHARSNKNVSRKLWTILIFMLWHQIFIEEKYNFQ